mmetsp:Transcript_8334/g.17927  ORF Transcript_8334/g.17927 Transcript_8334/m.17927 type:complete len:280 (+) Transcript_8334:17-856(+)
MYWSEQSIVDTEREHCSMITKSVVVLAALVAVAVAQCSCSFVPAGTASQVVLVTPGSPFSTCVEEVRPTGGCACVESGGDAGTCDIDSSAVRYEFIGIGSSCQEVSNPVALCPSTTVSATCYYDDEVAWVTTCGIANNQFPTGATITGVTLEITQTDNVTFTGTGVEDTAYDITYSTTNLIAPANAFDPAWPSTAVKEESGTIGQSGSVNFFASTITGLVTLTGNQVAIDHAQADFDAGNIVDFAFATQQSGTSNGFLTSLFFPAESAVNIVLTITYSP